MLLSLRKRNTDNANSLSIPAQNTQLFKMSMREPSVPHSKLPLEVCVCYMYICRVMLGIVSEWREMCTALMKFFQGDTEKGTA